MERSIYRQGFECRTLAPFLLIMKRTEDYLLPKLRPLRVGYAQAAAILNGFQSSPLPVTGWTRKDRTHAYLSYDGNEGNRCTASWWCVSSCAIC